MLRGAEAVLRPGKLIGRKIIIKERKPKTYRVEELDGLLRIKRTRQEARLLHKAKLAGVACPTILAVDDFSISMTFIPGKRPSSNAKNNNSKLSSKIYHTAGNYLAQLHAANIIHGDYTPANLLVDKELFVIDFGLGFFSTDIEDKAIDVFTMLKAIDEKCGKAFLEGYKKYEKFHAVMQRIEQVNGRVRYA